MSLNQPVGIPFQNPTSYIGPDMNIVPIKRFPRRPLTTDKKYRIGQTAILGSNPSTGVEGELWYLARFESNGDATWLQLATGASSPGIDFILTDDGAPAVEPDVTGTVNIVGGTGIITSGQGPGNTVTIEVDGAVVGQTITGDSGGALSPTAANWNIFGRSGSKTAGIGSTLTINSPPYADEVGSTTVTLNSGSFATNAITLTTPLSAGLLDGDLTEFIATNGVLVIQLSGTQVAHIGTIATSAGGTLTSTANGDSVSLRYQASSNSWWATSVIGTWVMA